MLPLGHMPRYRGMDSEGECQALSGEAVAKAESEVEDA